jgi:hypothetical protein
VRQTKCHKIRETALKTYCSPGFVAVYTSGVTCFYLPDFKRFTDCFF